MALHCEFQGGSQAGPKGSSQPSAYLKLGWLEVTPIQHLILVGGFNPSEKYESQLGWLFPIDGKMKNVPKHQHLIGFVQSGLAQNSEQTVCLTHYISYQFPHWNGATGTVWFWEYSIQHIHNCIIHMYPICEEKLMIRMWGSLKKMMALWSTPFARRAMENPESPWWRPGTRKRIIHMGGS